MAHLYSSYSDIILYSSRKYPYFLHRIDWIFQGGGGGGDPEIPDRKGVDIEINFHFDSVSHGTEECFFFCWQASLARLIGQHFMVFASQSFQLEASQP